MLPMMKRPWISVNFAISADGKIAPVTRKPSGWTSEADHMRLLELRRGANALLAGKGTVVADRMTMTVPNQDIQPLRCIVTHQGDIPQDLPLFSKEGGPIYVCVTGEKSPVIPGATVCQMSLAAFLHHLATEHGVKRLHCEGGGQLVAELTTMDAIDEFHLTIAGHTIFGGKNAPTVTGVPGPWLGDTKKFELHEFSPQPETGECFLTYRRVSEHSVMA